MLMPPTLSTHMERVGFSIGKLLICHNESARLPHYPPQATSAGDSARHGCDIQRNSMARQNDRSADAILYRVLCLLRRTGKVDKALAASL